MNINQKDVPVFQSLDKLCQEMATFEIHNERPKLIEEIEEDILNSAKKKKINKKEINSNNAILFSSNSSDNQHSNLSSRENNNNYSFISQNSKKTNKTYKSNYSTKRNGFGNSSLKEKNNVINNETNIVKNNDKNNLENSFNRSSKKVSFALDKKDYNEEISSSKISSENLYINHSRDEEESINDYLDGNFEGNKIFIKNDKEDIEISLMPIHKSKGKEEISYSKIKSYIDKNKKKMQKMGFFKDQNNNSNLTATLADKDNASKNSKNSKNKILRKNQINPLIIKEKQEEKKKKVNLILKSFTQRPNSLTKILNNNPNKIKERNSLKEKRISHNNFDEADGFIKFIDNITEEVSESNSSEKIINSSSFLSNLENSGLNFSLSTSSNNNNLILDYSKNGKIAKHQNFFEKEIKRQKLKELKINKMKRDKEIKEFQNYYSFPKINSFSLQIVNSKGKYIPLFKRAIELENEKKIKRMIYQKMQNKNFIINNSNNSKRTNKQINDFFFAQMSWKDKIEKKNNKLKNIIKDKIKKENPELKNYKIKINPVSERIISKKRGNNYLSYLDKSHNNKIIISKSAKRLYKDYEIRQKKINILKKELTPSFRPNINKASPSYYYKTSKKNHRRNISQKIEEIKYSDYIDNSHRVKHHSYNKLSYKNDTPISIKQQKSRNFRGATNNQIFSRFFSKKENNLKSTDVDSKNTKSIQKALSDINKTKLEKINENNKSKEENSNSINKDNDKNKINKSKINTTLRDIHNTSKNSKNDENNQKNKSYKKNSKSKISNSKTNNNDNTKNIENESKENYNDYKNTNSKHKNKTNLPNNSESKNTIEEYLSKNNKKIDKNINNQSTDKEKDKYNQKNNNNENKNENQFTPEISIQQNNKKINKNENQFSPKIIIQQNDKKMNDFRKLKSININAKIPSHINKNPISKIMQNIKINKNNYIKKNTMVSPYSRHKSLMTKKTSDLLLTSKFSERIESKNDNYNDERNEIFEFNNLEKSNNNDLLNEFFSNRSNSKQINNSKDIINNSLYNYEDEIIKEKNDSFFDDEYFKSEKKQEKQKEKKIIKKYNLNSLNNEENEEEEEIEDNNDGNKSKETNKSFSWIKKLEEISKNEEMRIQKEKEEINKKKKMGASTTRSQTNRKSIEKEKDINNKGEKLDDNKLYMLNLRNSSSTGNLNPYTFTAHNQIFYKFFLKK